MIGDHNAGLVRVQILEISALNVNVGPADQLLKNAKGATENQQLSIFFFGLVSHRSSIRNF